MWIDDLERRKANVRTAARYYVEYKWSMRKIAENMCIGETTVRRYLNQYLKHIDDELYVQVQRRKQEVKKW